MHSGVSGGTRRYFQWTGAHGPWKKTDAMHCLACSALVLEKQSNRHLVQVQVQTPLRQMDDEFCQRLGGDGQDRYRYD